MRSYLFLALLFLLPHIAFAANPAPIYISQIQISGGVNNSALDFIELFNAGTAPFNLKGYRLVKRSAGSLSDSSIKSWTKDAFIPAKSFYLWANSGYTSIRPDVTTTATIADDSGVGLRQGGENSGQLLDSVSWGNANNSFSNVSTVNPGANESLQRENLYSAPSVFKIAPSRPHNSTVTDLTAAFAEAGKLRATIAAKPSPSLAAAPFDVNQEADPSTTLATPNQDLSQTTEDAGNVAGTSTFAVNVDQTETTATADIPSQYAIKSKSSRGKGYLALAGGALLVLAGLLLYLFKQKN